MAAETDVFRHDGADLIIGHQINIARTQMRPSASRKLRSAVDLGLFSISLAVKDLEVSKAFYEKLGFETTGGSMEHNYLILVNGSTVIGLFHGMFEKNILTFNPGITIKGETLDSFTDVREIQRVLQERGIELIESADADSEGAAHITFEDPDGNPILIDQFS